MFSTRAANGGSGPLQLCVFDTRRQCREGEEEDKILYFFPEALPLDEQKSVVGLSEGLLNFTRIFSADRPCEALHCEKQLHAFYECEPGIWMVLIIKRGQPEGLDTHLRDAALQAVLQEAYSLYLLFHGPIQQLLDDHPSETVRQRLASVLRDYCSTFNGGRRKFRLPSLSDGLSERGSITMLQLDRGASLSVQSLLNLLHTAGRGQEAVRHTLLLYHDLLLATSLPPEDAAVLYTYASQHMSPGVVTPSRPIRRTPSGVTPPQHSSHPPLHRTSSTRDPPTPNAKGIRSLFANPATSGGSGNLSDLPPVPQSGSSAPPSPRAPKEQYPLSQVRPLREKTWYRGGDDFLATDAWGDDGSAAVLFLNKGRDAVHLRALQQRNFTLLILGGKDLEAAVLTKSLMDKVAQRLEFLEPMVARHHGGVNRSHVPGYRYCHVDRVSRTVRASPAGKVATLSQESLAALNQARAEWDADGASDHSLGEKEVCIRAHNNAWVVIRRCGSQELFVVLEKASETLLAAGEAVEQLSYRYFDGMFSAD